MNLTPTICLAVISCLMSTSKISAETVNHWRFEQTPGFLVDSAGASTLIASGGASRFVLGAGAGSGIGTFFPGPAGSEAAQFPFSTSSLRGGVAPTTGSFTVELFVHLIDHPENGYYGAWLVGNHTAVNSPLESSWNLMIRTDNAFQSSTRELVLYVYQGSGGAEDLQSSFVLEKGVDYFVAAAFDATAQTTTFYVQNLSAKGPLQTSQVSQQSTGLNSIEQLWIGGILNRADFRTDGIIDEVRISDTALTAEELIINPNCPDTGRLYGISGEAMGIGKLIQIDTCTGAGVEVATLPTFGGDGGLAFDSTRNVFYVLDGGGASVGTLYSVLRGTPWTVTELGFVDLSPDLALADPGLAYDPTSDSLYLVEESNDRLYRIGISGPMPILGPVTDLGPLGGGGGTTSVDVSNVGLSFDVASGLLYAVSHDPIADPSGTGYLIEIDPLDPSTAETIGEGIGGQLTGAALDQDREIGFASDSFIDDLVMTFPKNAPKASSSIGSTGFSNVEGLAWVPEPNSRIAVGVGVVLLAFISRRSRAGLL